MDRAGPDGHQAAWWNTPSTPADSTWFSARTTRPPDPEAVATAAALPAGPYPSASDYVSALQAPATALTQPELRAATPRSGMFGLPAVTTGQNAAVFTLEVADGSTLALRTFTSKPSRGPELYTALAGMPLLDCLTSVGWFDDEIAAKGARWPLVTMPWVEGLTLERWLDAHRHEAGRLQQLRGSFHRGVDALHAAGITHGDLQHGNIIVTGDDEVVFVDYDGMMLFDPTTGQPLTPQPTEAGHPNYQHPQRITEGGADRYSDTFSATLINLSLGAIANDPSLYRGDGNSLVLTAEDLDDPFGEGTARFTRVLDALDDSDRRTGELLRQWCNHTQQLELTPAALTTIEELPPMAARRNGPSQRLSPVDDFAQTAAGSRGGGGTAPDPAGQGRDPDDRRFFWAWFAAALAVIVGTVWVSNPDIFAAAQAPPQTGASSSAGSSNDTDSSRDDASGGSTADRAEPTPPPAPEWTVGSCVQFVGDQGRLVSCSSPHDAVIVRRTSSTSNCSPYYWPQEHVTSPLWFSDVGASHIACVAPSSNAPVVDYRLGACLRGDIDNLMPVPCDTPYDFFITDAASDPSWCPDYWVDDGRQYWCMTR